MKNDYNDEVAVLVFAYEGFEEIWPIFFDRLNKYWKEVPFKLYFASSKAIKINYDYVFLELDKEQTWTERLCSALNKVDSKYVLFFLEDWLITTEIDNENIYETINYILKNDILYYKFFFPSFSSNYNKKFKFDENRYYIDENRKYGISIQPAVWNREYLVKLLERLKINAWEFEKELDSMNLINEESLIKHVYDSRNLLNLSHALIKGKYVRNVYKIIKKEYKQTFNIKQMGIVETFVLKCKQLVRRLFPKVLRKKRYNYNENLK